MAEPFGQTCGLGDDELRYFVDLVAFKQATSLAERAKQRSGCAHLIPSLR